MTTFLTSTCHRNYKKCVQIATMDYCGHLMKQCHETKEFILPEPVSKIQPPKHSPFIFSEEENEVNLVRCKKKRFYDQKICRHLCSTTLVLESTRANSISPCESMCFQLTRSSDTAGEVCPFQKYCQKGCPCPFYDCEKLQSRQKMTPIFDLKQKSEDSYDTFDTKFNGDIQLITKRWEDYSPNKHKFSKIVLSDLAGTKKQTNVSDWLYPYERF